eukprot:4507965-Amphidinium_carterae.1
MVEQDFSPEEGNAANPMEASPVHGLAVEPETVEADRPDNVRVDFPIDQRIPADTYSSAAVATQLPAEGADVELDAPVYRVGPHLCQLTVGDTRITCKKCGRYVTTYKGTWRNMGTIAKQPCKPKARRQKGREGKAPCKQSGGALPALPPGSRPRGRAPRPERKLKGHDSRTPIASSSCVPQATRGRAPGPSKKLKSHDSRMPIASSSCGPQAPESLRVPEQSQLTFRNSCIEEPGFSSSEHQKRQCALCREIFHVATLRGRAIRGQ